MQHIWLTIRGTYNEQEDVMGVYDNEEAAREHQKKIEEASIASDEYVVVREMVLQTSFNGNV